MAGIIKGLLKGFKGKKPISYDEAKELARHKDHKVRRELAERQDIKPEILYFLADDPSPEVRRKIASNSETPRHADLLLAQDKDEDVRTDLAGKIAKLAPGLTDDEQDKVRETTYNALEILARDQATQVRRIISETLKDVANAPPEVIKRLARDLELVVSGPVLEFSPVLSDEDLLEIISGSPVSGALSAISRRAKVNESLADAIFFANDDEAIAELLTNDSAQIREETLDQIISRAPDVELWHAPLVKRPVLPSGAAARLARFVADNLVDILTMRKDLDPETAEAVKQVVHKRIEDGDLEDPQKTQKEKKGKKSKGPKDEENNKPWSSSKPGETPLDVVKKLRKEGKLNEALIMDALKAGEAAFTKAALAVLVNMQPTVIENIIIAKSSKGIVSLVWKAGLSMKLAEMVQTKIARIQPREVIGAASGGGFPLTEDEMKWQLDFLGDI